MKFDLSDYAESMRERVARAKAGDEDAARFLLEEFVHNAGCFRHGDLQASDRVVLDFVVAAIRETLEGVDPKKALCLSSGEPGPVGCSRIRRGPEADPDEGQFLDPFGRGLMRFIDSSGNVAEVSFRARAVPEPASFALLGLALAGLGFARRRKLH